MWTFSWFSFFLVLTRRLETGSWELGRISSKGGDFNSERLRAPHALGDSVDLSEGLSDPWGRRRAGPRLDCVRAISWARPRGTDTEKTQRGSSGTEMIKERE